MNHHDFSYPLTSLQQGNWFKLISGASYQDLPTVRSMAIAYSLAGADCIDVAADEAVIAAAIEGIEVGVQLGSKTKQGFLTSRPWLMVSVNDGKDPHFRKAQFEASRCPPQCPRPCEAVCPASAIDLNGVIAQKCYGCGRCIGVCPENLIVANNYIATREDLIRAIASDWVDAIEIHTRVGHQTEFQRLWQQISPYLGQLKAIAISCGDAPDLIDYLNFIYDSIKALEIPIIWQTDGRPMSGDIGIGTTGAAVKLAQRVLAARLPGFVQLAGGTNQYTVAKLQQNQLLKYQTSDAVAGVAYGSYARGLLMPILALLEDSQTDTSTSSCRQQLEKNPLVLWQAVTQARSLVSQIKSWDRASNHLTVPVAKSY